MSAGYYVSAPMVIAISEDGTQRYFYAGATITEDVPAAEVQRLLDEGLLKEVPEIVLPEVTDNDGPRETWTNEKLTAYAEQHSIDLGGATKKADILAAIDKAEKV